MALAVTTSVCHSTRNKLKACIVVNVVGVVVKEGLNALYKYTQSRPAKYILISRVLMLRVLIDIDQYQAFSPYHQTLGRILLLWIFLEH
jgi:hypothetical protein